MRKAIVSLPVLCACVLSQGAFAITGPTMRDWQQDKNDAFMKISSKVTDADILGSESNAKDCGIASLSRLLFEAGFIDTYAKYTIPQFAKNITTVSNENGIKVCQFSIPYDKTTEKPFLIRYTINQDNTYDFVINGKDDASKILWYMAPWLTTQRQIKALFEHGAENIILKFDNPKTGWKDQESTLCRYVFMNNSFMVEKLLENGADVNGFCYSKISQKDFSKSYIANPLSLAVVQNNEEMVKFLLEKGAVVEQNDSIGTEGTTDFLQSNPIVDAVLKNNEILSLLLKQKNVNANQYLKKGTLQMSPLFIAINNGNTQAIDLLISAGANFDDIFVDEDTKMNAVWELLLDSNILKDTKKAQQILEKLIKGGADYNSCMLGHTPLAYAKIAVPGLVSVFKKYNAKEDLEVLEHDWCVRENGIKRICGKVKNNTDEEKNAVVLLNYYDKDGYLIGNDTTRASKLEPGGVWKFDNVIPKDGTVSYKIVDVKTSQF